MSLKDNINKEMFRYSYIEKENIFTVNANYAIALRVSDIWEEGLNLILEVTFNNFQKAYLSFGEFENSIINIKFWQKQLNKNRYNEQFKKHLKQEKLNYKNNSENIEITLKNKERLVIEKKQFRILLIDVNGKIKTQTSVRPGWDNLEGFCSPGLGYKIKEKVQLPFLTLQLASEELLYGLGEKFNNFVKNGTQSVIYNLDNQAVSNGDLGYGGVPLVYSNQNWAMLVNTGYKTEWEVGSPITESLSVLSYEECFDILLFTSDSIKNLVSLYTEFTGRITGVPDEAYGIWLNRLYYHNKNELFTEINNAEKFNYPVDVFTLDPKWIKNRYTKTCNFEFNEEQFGNLKELLDEVHKKNAKMCFWINPYIQIDNSSTWKEIEANKFYTKRVDGGVAHIWSGLCNYQENATAIDLTNPDAVVYWKNKIKDLLISGLDFIKTDYGDSIDEKALMYNGELGKNFRNAYIELYLRYAYEATQEVHGKDKGFVLSRPGYIGTNKYVGKWAGDSASSFNELKMQMWSGLSNSLCGTVMWGTDIGGFLDINVKEKDLYARWSQFGLLTPFSRYHGVGAREPWYFGEKDLEISRNYAILKRRLLPYYKVYEKQSIEKGLPIIRPLVLEFQNDSIASKVDNQFMLGQKIMIAPILSDQKYKRQVYFPEGQWVSFFDKKQIYEGNKLYEIDCPIENTLIFVKQNSVIPLMKSGNYKFNKIESEKIVLNIYGEVNDETLEFRINNKDYKVVVKNNNIEKNDKFEIL
ncbi:TIM-barrel domain-containing protein [Spiroplasma tabanidicola]|uniref:Alpha-D-xyloside xylohydrolase n=1 Tax=Spiroplasma tabanidicola TaxID=324079 RepID=A0A6I6C9A5_9MOLU|nr:TIM-barrel domain-containing protein [Spiroplasma tabanidicola]QGS51481.1 alpha-D-xyloside xylohydrolase [Spiroplasma tabanidicola]